MNVFLRRLVTLVIPLLLECLDETLSKKATEEGQCNANEKDDSDK